jgi:hypothetical protein
MKTFIYKLVLAAGLAFPAIMLLNGCSKSEVHSTIASNENYLENTMLNRDLFVSGATDDGVNITDNFTGYTFRLESTIYGASSGLAYANNITNSIQGTWAVSGGKDKIVFDFPSTLVANLAYMNKEWVITKGSNPIKLNAANGENDVLYFTAVK